MDCARNCKEGERIFFLVSCTEESHVVDVLLAVNDICMLAVNAVFVLLLIC